MKGIIFNVLEDVVCAHFGEDFWCDMLDLAKVQGSYTSLGNYPDSELLSLVATASRLGGLAERDVLCWFGRHALPRLARRFPSLMEGHQDGRDFLLSVNGIIHPEVRKLYPGAICPHFQFQHPGPRNTLVRYRSPRRLCALVEGFIQGSAEYFGTQVSVTHESCTHQGARDCELAVRWAC